MNAALPLRQLVGGFDALSVHGPLDTTVAALAYDARRVVPGAVFFAVPRAGGGDGPAIPRAIERGAAAIVCEEPGQVPYRATRIRVANCRRAMASAAAAFFGHPSRRLQVVVVTGCEARGAVACLVYQLLAAAGGATAWAGSRGCRVGERRLPPLPPEPEALDVQELLAAMVRAGCRTAVVELSPRAIEHGTLAATKIASVFVTELADGSGQVGSPPSSRGLQWPAPGPEDVRGIDGGVWRLSHVPAGGTHRSDAFALRLEGRSAAPGMITGRCRRSTATSTHLEAATPRGGFHCRLPLPGHEQARAGLAAASMALALGVPLPAVSAGLSRVDRVPGSLEPVRTRRGFQVLVDAASSASELETVLRDVRGFTAGRVLLLFGCGSRHPAAERVAMGEVAARGADHAILTNDNPGWEPPGVIVAHVAAGHVRGRGLPPRIVPDRAQAIRELLREARRGDVVLLTGKGHRMVQELAGCVLPFDDRMQARAALAAFDAVPPAEEAEAS